MISCGETVTFIIKVFQHSALSDQENLNFPHNLSGNKALVPRAKTGTSEIYKQKYFVCFFSGNKLNYLLIIMNVFLSQMEFGMTPE